jgi:penicillin-binding protein 2
VKNRYEDAEIGFDIWRKYVMSFGFGKKLGTDFVHEKSGSVPSNQFYDRIYGDKRWKASTIISNAIGQGELLVTPMQMANLVAIIANKGYYYRPHMIKKVDGGVPHELEVYYQKNYTMIDSVHFDPIIEAMQGVVENGTARRAITKDIVVCGKTGTAENPHGEDHSCFVAFAPRENPQIAIAVYVENAGYGGTWAAPISSLMIEKYIKREITNERKEKRILEKNFINPK